MDGALVNRAAATLSRARDPQFLLWHTMPGSKVFKHFGWQEGSCWLCFQRLGMNPAANRPATHMFRCKDVCPPCLAEFPDLSGDFHVIACEDHTVWSMRLSNQVCPHGQVMVVSEPIRLTEQP